METINFIEKLIYAWCIKEDQYGLTLPNIIGAIRTSTTKKEYSIDDFFDELPNIDLDVKISFCGDLEEFVIGTFKRQDAPKKYYAEINTIYYTERELEIQSYNDLIIFFEEKYSDKIEKGLYSKNYYSKEWNNFNEKEKEFFKEINE